MLLSKGVDKLAWSGSPKGTFDLKSACRIVMGDECIEPFSAHWIWKVNTLPRIRTFLWKCAHIALELRFALRGRMLVMILHALYARKELKAFYMP